MKKVYLIAVIVALIAGGATYLFANQIVQATQESAAGTIEVLVPVSTIPESQVITSDNINTLFTTEFIFKSDMEMVDGVLGASEMREKLIEQQMQTTQMLFPGEPVNINKFTAKGSAENLSGNLDKENFAYTINASGDQGVDGYIVAGDTVDIIYTDISDDDSKETNIDSITNLKVLVVSDNTSNVTSEESGTAVTTYSAITLEVTQDEATELYKMEANSGSYKLILHSSQNGSDN